MKTRALLWLADLLHDSLQVYLFIVVIACLLGLLGIGINLLAGRPAF